MQHAFSLLELIIVIAIIAILAAVAAPRIGSAGVATRIDAFESRLASEVASIGESARAAGSSRSIVFDTDTESMLAYEGSTGVRGDPLRTIGFGESPYSVDITGWSESGAGYVTVDGFGIYSKGFKVNVAVDDLIRVVTIRVPSPDAEAAPVGGGGG